MKSRLFGSLLAATAAVFIASPASAEMNLKFTSAAPTNTPWAAHFNDIAESVGDISNGGIKINLFNGNQLGNEQDTIRQVVRGRIHMGGFSNTAASLIVPEIALLAAPYLWDNTAQADCALDNYLLPYFQKPFEQKGLIILGWTEVGYMGYASKSPIENPAAMIGKKIRVAPTKASSIAATAFGANSVVLPIPDVASGLQTGLVEGADLPALLFASMGFAKIAPNWTASNHSHQVGMVLMSKKVWKKLSKEQQDQIMSIQIPPVKLRQQVRGATQQLLGKFASEGGNLIIPTEAQMKEWRAIAEQSQQEMVKAIGKNAAESYSAIQKAKLACSP